MKIPTRRVTIYPWSAIPDAGLALAFLIAWVVPGLLGTGLIANLMLIIETEAFAVFVGIIVASFFRKNEEDPKHVWGVVFLVAVMGFATYEALRYGFWRPMLALVFLIANRLNALLGGRLDSPAARAAAFSTANWALGFYLGAFLLSQILPAIGPSPDVSGLAEHARWCRAPDELLSIFLESEAKPPWVWCDAPYKAMACGFVYFATMAVFSLFQPGVDRVDNPDKTIRIPV